MADKVLIADDDPLILDLMDQELSASGFAVHRAGNGVAALQAVETFQPDVVLLDYNMPVMNGLEVMRALRQDPRFAALPIIMVTGHGAQEDKVRGLDAGADDYIVKPFDPMELMAHVRSMLRIKRLHDALEEANRTLEDKVQQQVAEIQRLARLKRYLAPQIADTILKDEEASLFQSHRREITVVSLDLRGFTRFVEASEPEEVFSLLRAFHAEMGELIFAYEGTVKDVAGDGMMVFFNDPVPADDHPERAARMALAIRDRARFLREAWLKAGYDLDVGLGLVAGYATLGEVGFEGRREYAAVGSVPNLAARLCAAAKGGQVLTNRRTLSKVESLVEAEYLEDLELKGFAQPVPAYALLKLKVPEADRLHGPLSSREQEVAALVAQGLSNKEIAKTLFIGERTAETHIQSILNKLGFHARTQIASWAVARGLGKPSD